MGRTLFWEEDPRGQSFLLTLDPGPGRGFIPSPETYPPGDETDTWGEAPLSPDNTVQGAHLPASPSGPSCLAPCLPLPHLPRSGWASLASLEGTKCRLSPASPDPQPAGTPGPDPSLPGHPALGPRMDHTVQALGSDGLRAGCEELGLAGLMLAGRLPGGGTSTYSLTQGSCPSSQERPGACTPGSAARGRIGLRSRRLAPSSPPPRPADPSGPGCAQLGREAFTWF